MSSDLESSSHSGQHSRRGRGSVSRGICLPGFLLLEAPLCPVPPGGLPGDPWPGFLRLRLWELWVWPGPPHLPPPAAPRSLRFPSPVSNARLLPPSCPSAGPSLLGPSLPPPIPEAGKPRPRLERRQQVRTPSSLALGPSASWSAPPPRPSQGECRLPWECVGRTLRGEIQDPPPSHRS